jgi:hypothetical protein
MVCEHEAKVQGCVRVLAITAVKAPVSVTGVMSVERRCKIASFRANHQERSEAGGAETKRLANDTGTDRREYQARLNERHGIGA